MARTVVSGIPELQRVFTEFKRGAANRIVRPAITKAARIGVKKIKAAIPSRYKGVRRAIGFRSLKKRFN